MHSTCKRTNQRTFVLGILLALLCYSLAYGQHRGMTFLGDARVDGGRDNDTINVGGAANGAFRAIQLRVTGGAVRFDRVVVRYGNGTQEEIPIRSRIAAGGKTRIIDLPGERRIIRSVDLWYGKARWATRPRVSLYGVR